MADVRLTSGRYVRPGNYQSTLIVRPYESRFESTPAGTTYWFTTALDEFPTGQINFVQLMNEIRISRIEATPTDMVVNQLGPPGGPGTVEIKFAGMLGFDDEDILLAICRAHVPVPRRSLPREQMSPGQVLSASGLTSKEQERLEKERAQARKEMEIRNKQWARERAKKEQQIAERELRQQVYRSSPRVLLPEDDE